MAMFCRITGKSRGLPKPNYFPLLPPISPADAKKLCRITGKVQGPHHFTPIPLVPKKRPQTCPITGKSVGQPQHHFIPELPLGSSNNLQQLKHLPISGYRYVVPVLDNPPALLQELMLDERKPDEVAAQYVYTLEEKRYSIVLPATIEAAVREGTVSGMSLSADSSKVAIKLSEGRQVTIEVHDMKPQPTNEIKKQVIESESMPLLDGQGPTQKVLEKRRKALKGKPKDAELNSIKRIFEDKENAAEQAERMSVVEKKPKLEKSPVNFPLQCNGVASELESILKESVNDAANRQPEIANSVLEPPTNKTIPISPVIHNASVQNQHNQPAAEHAEKNFILQNSIAEIQEILTTMNLKQDIPVNEYARINEEINTSSFPRVSSVQAHAEVSLDTSVLKCIWEAAKQEELMPQAGLDDIATLQDILRLTKNIGKGSNAVCKWNETILHGQNIEICKGKTCFVPGNLVNGKFIPGRIVDNDFIAGLTVKNNNIVVLIPGCVMVEEGMVAGISNEGRFVPGHLSSDGDMQVFKPAKDYEASAVAKRFITNSAQTRKMSVIESTFKKADKLKRSSTDSQLHSMNGTYVSELNSSTHGHIIHERTEKQRTNSRESVNKTNLKQMNRNEGRRVKTSNSAKSVIYGHMLQTEDGIQFLPEGNEIPNDGVKRTIPGQLVKCDINEEEPHFIPGMKIDGKFIAGQMVRTAGGTKFVPGQLVKNKHGTKFVPGQTLDDGQFVPGQVVDDKFVPGQIVETTAGPTFIPGQVISTLEEGSRFVPGRVVDTSEGPRFVPGRVIEDVHGGVSFVPGSVVDTGNGLRFVAPDLQSTPDGCVQYSMQSFEVSPEELQLIDQQSNNVDVDTCTVDSKMLQQLADAGITLAQKKLPDVYICPIRNLKEIAVNITERLKLPESALSKMSVILEKASYLGNIIMSSANSESNQGNKSNAENKPKVKDQAQILAFDLIESAVRAAITTAARDICVNPGEAIIQELSCKLENALPLNASRQSDDFLITALYDIVTSDANLQAISSVVQQGLKYTISSKVEVLKDLLNRAEDIHETVEKISSVLSKPKSQQNIAKAFKRLSASDPRIVDLVVSKVGEMVESVSTEKEAARTLQNSIVSAIRESSEQDILEILDKSDQNGLKHLILQAVGLARSLGLSEAAEELLVLLKDTRIATALATDPTALDILQRLTLMKKLSGSRPAHAQALGRLDPGTSEDSRYLRQLVRESEALLTSVREEDDSQDDDDDYTYSNSSFNLTFDDEIINRIPKCITSSNDIPQALFHAIIDCQKPMQLLRRLLKALDKSHRYSYDHACVILKNNVQAVIPKESSCSVLTGKASYTVIDEKGVREFSALDVFSALNIDKPIALKKFSMYCSGLDSTWVDAKEIEPDVLDDDLTLASCAQDYLTTAGTISQSGDLYEMFDPLNSNKSLPECLLYDDNIAKIGPEI